jgi:anti-sigma factor RsiW
MLTDLYLQKYLDGELSEEDEKELEARLEKDPELKARLEALENQSQVVGQHVWQRFRKGRHARRGSRTRYTTMLPALLFLILVLMVASHWFARPGENSTFTMSGGTGSAIELLYDSPNGWRYLDKDYAAGDSLTFSVRDANAYHVAVAAVYGNGSDAEVETIWPDAPDRAYDKKAKQPVFLPVSRTAPGVAPSQIVVFYDDAPLPELPPARVLDLLSSRGNERGGLDFQYQVFSAGR